MQTTVIEATAAESQGGKHAGAESAGADAVRRPAEIQGIVDNASLRHLHGWAWNLADPQERLVVELRLGDTTLAEVVAEAERPDLLKAGIGDGHHAFSLPLTAECMRRRDEISVVARAADGSAAPIPFHLRRREEEGLPSLQKAVQAVGGAQRRLQAELRESIQALSARLPENGEREALHALAETQARLEDRLEVLTLWLTRLDDRLAQLPQATPPAPPRRLDAWQAVLVAVLGGIAALALSGLPGLLAG